MHIYAFGSLCRGDVDQSSDVDLLALVSGHDDRFDPSVFSVYSYDRISVLWDDGSPFAWHLATEAVLIYASDGLDVLKRMGDPAAYDRQRADCEKFRALFLEARLDLRLASPTFVFDLSTIFLAIRNFASCYLLGKGVINFSRHAALHMGAQRVPLCKDDFSIFERARLLCTRGIGEPPSESESNAAIKAAGDVEAWMIQLLEQVPA